MRCCFGFATVTAYLQTIVRGVWTWRGQPRWFGPAEARAHQTFVAWSRTRLKIRDEATNADTDPRLFSETDEIHVHFCSRYDPRLLVLASRRQLDPPLDSRG